MVLKTKTFQLVGGWCVCASHSFDLHLTTQVGAVTEAHRHSYVSPAYQDRNMSTTYNDPSILDHLGLSSNLTSHPSVHSIEA